MINGIDDNEERPIFHIILIQNRNEKETKKFTSDLDHLTTRAASATKVENHLVRAEPDVIGIRNRETRSPARVGQQLFIPPQNELLRAGDRCSTCFGD